MRRDDIPEGYVQACPNTATHMYRKDLGIMDAKGASPSILYKWWTKRGANLIRKDDSENTNGVGI